MDIVIEQVPEEPTQNNNPTDARSDTLEEAQLDAALNASSNTEVRPDHSTGLRMPTEEIPEPTPKRRGRPPGSKNKPRIIEDAPLQAERVPVILNEPPPELTPKKPAAIRKPRAPKAQPPRCAPSAPQMEAPTPQTPLQVAASMLEILRLEQTERQYRKGQMYTSWVK